MEVNAPTRANTADHKWETARTPELNIASKEHPEPHRQASQQSTTFCNINQPKNTPQNADLRLQEVPPKLLQQLLPRALPRRPSKTPVRSLRPTLRRHNAAGQFLPHTGDSAALRTTRPESEDDD